VREKKRQEREREGNGRRWARYTREYTEKACSVLQNSLECGGAADIYLSACIPRSHDPRAPSTRRTRFRSPSVNCPCPPTHTHTHTHTAHSRRAFTARRSRLVPSASDTHRAHTTRRHSPLSRVAFREQRQTDDVPRETREYGARTHRRFATSIARARSETRATGNVAARNASSTIDREPGESLSILRRRSPPRSSRPRCVSLSLFVFVWRRETTTSAYTRTALSRPDRNGTRLLGFKHRGVNTTTTKRAALRSRPRMRAGQSPPEPRHHVTRARPIARRGAVQWQRS